MYMVATTKEWTLEELHRLPDDGNMYELVLGELFVTPPPNEQHETIAARLTRILDPYVAAQKLGANSVDWDEAPTPILIVEIQSPSTRRRDMVQKRQLYLDAGAAEYWLVDPERRTVTTIRPGLEDQIHGESLAWASSGTSAPLTFEVRQIFG